jgi:hypothetical protein
MENTAENEKASSWCSRYEGKHQTVKLEDTFCGTFPYLWSDILLKRPNPLIATRYCIDQITVRTAPLQQMFRRTSRGHVLHAVNTCNALNLWTLFLCLHKRICVSGSRMLVVLYTIHNITSFYQILYFIEFSS